MKQVIVIIIFFLSSSQLLGQERYGLSSNPGSGTYGIFLNPAFSSRYALDWHINLFSFHQFIETDYAHVTNSNLFSVLSNLNNIDVVTKRNEINEGNTSRQLIFSQDGGKSQFSINTSILWPSGIWKKSEREKMGIFMHTRGMGSGFRIPEQLGYYEISEVIDTTVEIGKLSFSGATWTDLGFHYSRVINDDQYESAAVGINAKLVLPHESGRFSSNKSVDYSRFQDTFSATGLETDAGYNTFTSGSTSYFPRINGIGLSTDIGYHYANENYSYGISILDLGFAFVSRNAETYSIISDTTVFFDASQVSDPNDIFGIVEEVDRQLEPQVSREVDKGGSFTLGTPTAIALQYARPLSKKIAVSANLVQRLPLFRQGLRRPNSFSIVPTYRSGLLSISVPATLYEYSNPRVGINVSYWFFYVGTDHITSLVGSSNFSGTDIYLGFQWYPFDKASNKKGVHCFDFNK